MRMLVRRGLFCGNHCSPQEKGGRDWAAMRAVANHRALAVLEPGIDVAWVMGVDDGGGDGGGC